jgi:neural cell adhesion molecule
VPRVSIRRADQTDPYQLNSSEDGRIVLRESAPGTIELTIKSLTPADSSLYVCTAHNAVGVGEQSATLSVNYKPRFAPDHSQVAYTWARVTRNVTCEPLAGPPATVEWKRFGQHITPNNTYRIFATDTASFLQVHVREVDQGWIYGVYTCTAHNQLGDDSINIELRRASVPDAPRSVGVSSLMPDAVELEMGAPEDDGGMPVIGYRIQFDYQTKDFSITPDNKILLKNLKPSTTYILQISATNQVGYGNRVPLQIQTKSLNAPQGVSVVSPSTSDQPSLYRVLLDIASTGGLPITQYKFKFKPVAVPALDAYTLMYDSDWTTQQIYNDASKPSQHFDINNLVPGSHYQLQVRACNDFGCSPYSNIFTFETPPAPAGSQLTASSHASHRCQQSVTVLTLSTLSTALLITVRLLTSLPHHIV